MVETENEAETSRIDKTKSAIRDVAVLLGEFRVALLNQGFTSAESLPLMTTWLSELMRTSPRARD